jgi:hypothetical protein
MAAGTPVHVEGKDRMKLPNDVRLRLLELHGALVDAARREHEKVHGRMSPLAFLDTLINDPAFAWLQPLTTIIVRLDEQESETTADREAWLGRLRALLAADEAGSEFQRRHAEWLQRSAEVAAAHGAMMRSLRA